MVVERERHDLVGELAGMRSQRANFLVRSELGCVLSSLTDLPLLSDLLGGDAMP